MLDWLKTFERLFVSYDLESAAYSKLPLASTALTFTACATIDYSYFGKRWEFQNYVTIPSWR